MWGKRQEMKVSWNWQGSNLWVLEFLVDYNIKEVDENHLLPGLSLLRWTLVPQESRDCVTWQMVFWFFLSLWCLGGFQTQSGLTTFPTAVWGMDCGPEGMCEAQHWRTMAVLGWKQRNSPVSKNKHSSIFSEAATPKQDNMYGQQRSVAAADSFSGSWNTTFFDL